MLVRVPNVRWAVRLLDRGIAPENVRYGLRERVLRLPSLGLEVRDETRGFVVDSIHYAQSLVSQAGARLFQRSDDQVVIEVAGLTLEVQSQEEFFILNEIFVQQIYAARAAGPIVVWDIGMNVGFGSLYFAALPAVVMVHGYEPVPATFQQAQCNIALNPGLAHKIIRHNMGIGASAGRLDVEFSPRWKGSTDLRGGLKRLRARGLILPGEAETVSVEIVETGRALDAVIASGPGATVLAKIDCEGMEYEIVEALRANGRLGSIGIVLIEWHERGPEPLLASLREAGFHCFSLQPQGGAAGMIYGVKGVGR